MSNTKIGAKEKNINAAWELFREKGYEETTLQDIIDKSGTSRGAFYHHFRAKEDLLFRMAWYFYKKYKGWLDSLDTNFTIVEKLFLFDEYCCRLLEESEFKPFLQQLYGYEVMTSGTRYILDEDREYFKLVLALMSEGIKNGELNKSASALVLTRSYTGLQRGMTYSWLLENCRYSLLESAHPIMKLFLESIKA